MVELTPAEKVLILRRRMKLSQDKFGELLGVCGKTIQHIELGKVGVSASVNEKLQIVEQRQSGK